MDKQSGKDSDDNRQITQQAWYKTFAARVAVAYALFGILWILFSDKVLEFFVRDASLMSRIQTYKGWFYVLITAYLVYYLIRNRMREENAQKRLISEAEERYRTLVANIPGVVYRCEVALPWRVVYISSPVQGLTGHADTEFMQGTVNFLDFVHSEDIDKVRATVERAVQEDTLYELEYRVVARDGKIRWVKGCGGCVRDAEGRPKWLDGIILDVTDEYEDAQRRRRLELRMQQAQKLESLGVLAGGIAHDFNNLLMGILGNVDLALQDLPREAMLARERLEDIEKAGQRSAELTRQMLAYAGMGQFNRQPVNLNEIIQETGQLLEVSISKRAALQYELEEALPLVEADATQVRQVVMNLITNAAEATGAKDAHIVLRTKRVHYDHPVSEDVYFFEEPGPGDYVIIQVADSGHGMTREHMVRIFDPFYTTKFTGRGLGLASTLGIVRGHQGAISVASEVGKGTTFSIYLPALPVTMTEEKPSVASEAWQGRGLILIIDDEAMVRNLAEKLLKRLGFDVVDAADGSEGLSIYAEHQEDIVAVLLDLTMPGLSGEETFRKLRELRSDLCVIMTSGYGDDELAKRMQELCMDAFIQKPYSSQQLRDVLQPLYEQGRIVSR